MKSADPYYVRRRNDFFHLVQGEVFLSRKFVDRAKAEFEMVEKVHCGDPVYFLAQQGIARCMARVSDSLGIISFTHLLEHRGELIMGPLLTYPVTGSWTSSIWPESHLELAKLYLHRGKRSEAESHLTAALRLWRDADPSFRKAREAKELITKLQKVK